jgi:hypothetical protein
MKYLYTLLLAAAVTPAFAQTAPAAQTSLNYNRIAEGYSSDDILKGYNDTGSALLGNAFIVSGIYDDVKTKGQAFGDSISGLSGKLSGFGLAYKLNVCPGDLAIGYFYKTGTVYGSVDGGFSSTVASAEQKGFGLKYRQAINQSFEFSVGYTRLSTKIGFVSVASAGVPNQYYIRADELDENANVFDLSARYNITKNIDVTLEYAFKNQNSGGNKVGVSVGYNF